MMREPRLGEGSAVRRFWEYLQSMYDPLRAWSTGCAARSATPMASAAARRRRSRSCRASARNRARSIRAWTARITSARRAEARTHDFAAPRTVENRLARTGGRQRRSRREVPGAAHGPDRGRHSRGAAPETAAQPRAARRLARGCSACGVSAAASHCPSSRSAFAARRDDRAGTAVVCSACERVMRSLNVVTPCARIDVPSFHDRVAARGGADRPPLVTSPARDASPRNRSAHCGAPALTAARRPSRSLRAYPASGAREHDAIPCAAPRLAAYNAPRRRA